MPTRFELANALRILAIDAVQAAKSGHPGMPMGMADIAEVLWNDFLVHNPSNPGWWNRDRFILSNGHGSMLHYGLLHLAGYDLSLDDLKQFRQLHAKTPGHPEVDVTPGVETTTGPLGQGLANAVGMALAEQLLASHYNRPDFSMIDHFTYVFAGDGCLMEGISHEACSLAGTLGLGKLIVFWDDNGISIDGEVKDWFTEDIPGRFRAYGWDVIEGVDGHDPEAIRLACLAAREEASKPTIICCKTVIGFGSPQVAGSAKSHGAPLGEEEIKAVREQLGWSSQKAFDVPKPVYKAWNAQEKGERFEKKWQTLFEAYAENYPNMAQSLQQRFSDELPEVWSAQVTALLQEVQENGKPLATRKASQQCLEALYPMLPNLLGGSADLTGSNGTLCSASHFISAADKTGNYIRYGVREFGMAAIMNGLALYGGFIPYSGTFLTFVDYSRNAVRMAALMQQKVIHVLTHDSIGLGEDGPTHQPIEHLAMLRATPGVHTWRPCDHVETLAAWVYAVEQHGGPSCLALTRQSCEHQSRTADQLACIQRGGYALKSVEQPDCLLIATGSEVELAMHAAEQLEQAGHAVQVVSMPCMEVFLEQDQAYQESVLPPTVTVRVAVEAGSTQLWYRFVGLQGKVIGIDRFGESAPAKEVYQLLGVHSEAIVSAVQEQMNH